VLSTKKNAVTVPAETVMQGPQGAYVYVIKTDGTADRRPVTVAMTQEGRAVIDKGLSAGEDVVVEGQYRITQGGKLQIRSGPGSNTMAEGSTTSQVAGSKREPTQ
jgi:multidrug efflux system membrane fusion protein